LRVEARRSCRGGHGRRSRVRARKGVAKAGARVDVERAKSWAGGRRASLRGRRCASTALRCSGHRDFDNSAPSRAQTLRSTSLAAMRQPRVLRSSAPQRRTAGHPPTTLRRITWVPTEHPPRLTQRCGWAAGAAPLRRRAAQARGRRVRSTRFVI
jgi:hypothetical protein